MQPFSAHLVDIGDLKEHPRNYRKHPDDQLEHIAQSLRSFGYYRNVIAARDYTILAGHGVVQAARKIGLQQVPVIRLDVDPASPAALKVLAGDNEMGNLADTDDRALTEILKEIMADEPANLLGTGFDDRQLAALAYVTRPESELADIDEAAAWVGLPGFEVAPDKWKVVVTCDTEADAKRAMELLGTSTVNFKNGRSLSVHYPERPKADNLAQGFEATK